MSVKRRLQGYSGMRVDWPHIRSIESAASYDFDSTLRGLVTGISNPYLLRGFEVVIPSASIPANQLQVNVSDSAILCSTATESGTILTVPLGTPNDILSSASPSVIGAFQSGVPNYVALDYRRVSDTQTIDQTSGWSPSEAIEFQRTTPIAQVLQYRYVITTNGFGTNLPLWVVYVSSTGTVEFITKATTDLFRLGTGGANPNPGNSFAWGNLSNPQSGAVNPRQEWVNTDFSVTSNPVTVAPGAFPQAFQLGDFSIKSLKQWMDAVMTRIKEITDSYYWYFNSNLPGNPSEGLGGLSLFSTWWDSIGSVMTGTGNFTYNLVLQASPPSSGLFQSPQTDSNILPGDSYVLGESSGTIADVTIVNGSELIINSQTQPSFTFDEVLVNRRLFRPNGFFQLIDYSEAPNRWGWFARLPNPSGAPIAVASWTYSNVSGSALQYSLLDVVTSTAHGFNVGDLIETTGFSTTGNPLPTSVVQVCDVVSSTEFKFEWPFLLSGLVNPGGTCAEDEGIDRIPYMPVYTVNSWSYVGTAITIDLAFNNFSAPIIESGNVGLASNQITGLASVDGIVLNMAVSGPGAVAAGFTAGCVVTNILSPSSVEVSQTSSAPVTGGSFTFKQQIVVSGLVAGSNAPNGQYTVDGLGVGQYQIQITAAVAPTGSPTLAANAGVRPDIFATTLTVTGATPSQFNVENINANVISDSQMIYLVGPDTLPVLGVATGPIQFDAVVATSTVLNPIQVTTITNDGAGNLTITTVTPHFLVTTPGPLVFNIYGDPADSIYITEYQGVSIQYVSANVFKLLNTGIISGVSYTNPGNTQPTYIKFQNNPYPGPLSWSSDVYIKGIIGNKYFKLKKTATAATTADDPNVDPLANQFNTNGQTGTAYLQDGEVAFLKLQRNLSMSNAAVYSTSGGMTISGSTPPIDIYGNPLVSGDFVKFAGEDENKWIRIAGPDGTPVVSNSFNVIDDANQTPSIGQRPANTGPMVYCKGDYSLVYVKKYWQVDESADMYWIAVRRDNGGSPSKLYLRNLELSTGEVRNINAGVNTNLLIYTGANTEAATNPNYSVSAPGTDYSATLPLTVDTPMDVLTQQVTFTTSPPLGFQINDQIVNVIGLTSYTFTVRQVLSTRTVIFNEPLVNIAPGNVVTFKRLNFNIADSDNLTKAIRKDDRFLGSVNTALISPVYDQSCFVQQINFTPGIGSVQINSGDYIYQGPTNNPTALAWVMHGSAPFTETIEDAPITMPGGYSSVGPTAILVNIISGTFSDGTAIYQDGANTNNTVNNPGNPPFAAPSLPGGFGPSGIEIVLPPNQRTQVLGTGYVIWPSNSIYKANTNTFLTGEELMVIVNDGIRQAGIDYSETFGGPKAKIQIIRDTPPNTRIRFRTLQSYGSANIAAAASGSLQTAYNSGNTILESVGRPVIITSGDVNSGANGIELHGSLGIDGGPSQLGGIISLNGDQGFIIGTEASKPKQVWTGLEAIKTHSAFTGSGWIRQTAAQTVVGNAGTIITGSAVAIPVNTAARIAITATVRRSDGTHGVASFRIEGTFFQESGPLTVAGFPVSQNNGADGDGINYAIAFGLSGGNVVAVVYGAASSGVTQWVLGIDYQQVSLSS